jgi:hypothetical protein
MRQARHYRITSLQNNKENEQSVNILTPHLNLPILRNNKQTLRKEQISINPKKKTFINLCLKKSLAGLEKRSFYIRKPLETARNSTGNTLLGHLSGMCGSSRGEKRHVKSVFKERGLEERCSVLSKHEINSRMRAKMVDWLIEISEAYKCKGETLFLAIFIMDEYFRQCEQSLPLSDLHIIGVTSMFIACKYEEINPLKVKTVVRDITHNKITAKDII